MGIRSRSWKRGRACEAIIDLGDGKLFVCGKFTRDRSARCDEHRALRRPTERGPEQRRAS